MDVKTFYLKAVLGQFPFGMPEDEQLHFISLFQEKKFKKGDHLTELGQVGSFMGFITQGFVRFYFITNEGKEFNQTFKKENQLIADHYSILTGKPAIFSIQAMEDTTLLVADYREIKKLYDKHRGWDRMGRIILEENFVIKSERENELMTMNAEERFQKFQEKFADLAPRISQKDIALFVGVNPSTLNRMIKKA